MTIDVAIAGAGASLTVALLDAAWRMHGQAAMRRRRTRHGAASRSTPRGLAVARRTAFDAGPGRRAAVAVVLGLVAAIAGGGLLPALVVVGVVAAVPEVLARIARWRFDQRVEAELPPFLDEVARGMRAGLSPASAFLAAATIAGPTLRDASDGMVRRLRSGEDVERSCAAWADEQPSPGREMLATAVAVGAAVGVVHPRTIDGVAATLRERQAVAADLTTQALQARLSALVMTVAPMVFCAFLVLSDARASHFLLRTPAGLACALVGLALDSIAALWMMRIVQGARQ